MKNILLLTAILFCTLSANCQQSTFGGSLIVITPSTSGFVIVADKKMSNTSLTIDSIDNSKTFSETTKIWKLNKHYAYALTGTLLVTSLLDKKIVYFDLAKTVNKFLSKNDEHPDITVEFLSALGRYILHEYSSIKLSSEEEFDLNSKKTIAFDVVVCGYNPQIKKYQLGVVYTVGVEGEVSSNKLGVFSFSENDLPSSNPTWTGEVGLGQELLEGFDSKYDTLRKNIFVKDFIRNTNGKLYDPEYVIKFSKWLVEETSKIEPTVSKEVDIAIIGKTGFKWVKQKG